LLLTSLLAICAAAQQPAQRKPAPRMTDDDVVQLVAITPSDESKDAPADAKAEAGKPEAAKSEKKAVSPDEAAWRERVAQAREKAKALERAAEEAELRITSLRNELGVSGRGPQYRNQIAADLETAGQKLSELRKQSSEANADLKDLLEYGKEKGYSEAEGPKATTGEGKANEEFYRAKFATLNEEMQTAERRMQLYADRVRDIQQRILSTGSSGPSKKGGDNFTIAQLQQEKEEAQHSLDDAQAAKNRAIEKRDALIEEARRAGVPSGIFR
jgi:chromosome segregation ATPase